MKKTTLLLLFFFLSIPVRFSMAATFTNGQFDAGLTGWTTTGNVSINIAGQAELASGSAGFPAASLNQGDFFNGFEAIQLDAEDKYLNFDVGYQDLGASGSKLSVVPDSLRVSVLDEIDFSGNSDLNFDSISDFLFGASSASVSLNISSLAGHTVGLYFEFFDESDGRNSLFSVDNIFFSSRRQFLVVPEGQGILMILSGLGLVMAFRRFKKV